MNFSQELKPWVCLLDDIKVRVLIEELVELHILYANVSLIVDTRAELKHRLHMEICNYFWRHNFGKHLLQLTSGG